MARRLKHPRNAASRRRWLAASSLAMATAMLHPTPLWGQTVTTNGQGVRAQAEYDSSKMTYTPGTPTPAGTATDVVRVNTSDTLINWVPFDNATGGGAISFLPAGNGLFYIFDGSNFTVVNRILPADATRAVRFDGQVASFVNNGGALGGNIFFYSPGGIIVGSTGRFDVGSLVLTTSDITSTGQTLGFGASNPGSFVRIEPWAPSGAGDVSAQIQTFGAGSYFAILAPTVEQFGRVDAEGNVAYVAAEQATMTISGTLFDIVVDAGTDSTKGIEHTGTTTGSASAASTDRRIQMVAVPKNDALTMLVSGSVGYQPATDASIVNGSIVLSAGDFAKGTEGNIDIGPTSFADDTRADATGDITLHADGVEERITVGAGAPGPVDFLGQARGDVSLKLTSGAGMDVTGDLSLFARNGGAGGAITVDLDATGVTDPTSLNGLHVGGTLQLVASAQGTDDFAADGVGGDAIGGAINVSVANGAQFGVDGTLVLDASARGGFGFGQAGNSTGGTINLTMSGAASRVDVLGDLDISTRANAAVNLSDTPPFTPLVGADAAGGNFTLSFTDGSSSLGALLIDTGAEATSGTDAGTQQDNSSIAGNVSLAFAGGTHQIASLQSNSNAISGQSFDGAGNSVAGTVGRASFGLSLDAAAVEFLDDATVSTTTAGDIGGAAPGTAISISAVNGAALTLPFLAATAEHNNGNSTASGTAGGIAIAADGSTIDFGTINLTTDSTGLAASDKTAGDISLSATNGAAISGTSANLSARAMLGDSVATGRAIHSGGMVSLLADGSTITLASGLSINSSVVVPRGGDMTGAVSRGGDVSLRQLNAGAAMAFGSISIQAGAFGSNFATDFAGDGGNAAGGDVTIDVRAGDFTSDGLFIDTSASGHVGGFQILTAGDLAGDGGSAQAGNISLIAAGDSFATGPMLLGASASGGVGGSGEASLGAGGAGNGGAAIAGTVDIQALSGTVDLEAFVFIGPPVEVIGPPVFFDPKLVIDASAFGGAGGFGNGTDGGAGGDATGGSAQFTVGGADLTLDVQLLDISTVAVGGSGGDTAQDGVTGALGGAGGAGGNATGGTAAYTFTSGSTNLLGVTVIGSAYGGTGGTSIRESGGAGVGGAGGNATGGSATATLGQDSTTAFALFSRGYGGTGGRGIDGGSGGIGEGGSAQFNVANANVATPLLVLASDGFGGQGGSPYAAGGAGGAGGAGYGGFVGIDVFGLAGALSSDGGIEISSTGVGGAGVAGYGYFGDSDGGDGGAGGRGVGGTISLQSRDGATFALSTDGLVDARGFGGAGGAGGYTYFGYGGAGGIGGTAKGGAITLGATGGGTLTGTSVETGSTTLAASAIGGTGGNGGSAFLGPDVPPTPGANGAAEGGSVSLIAAGPGSLLSFEGDLVADASVRGQFDGRSNSSGADGNGGSIGVDLSGGGALGVTGNLTLDASAQATLGFLNLGNATGGTVDLSMTGDASALNVGGGMLVDVSAVESRTIGLASVPGGDLTGGQATLDFVGGTANVQNGLTITAVAGIETSEGISGGGTARAGNVELRNDGDADLTFGALTINAFAMGSYGGRPINGNPGEAGGDAFGGNVTLSNQGTGSLTANSIAIDVGAIGRGGGSGSEGYYYGAGGAGGNATAGTVVLATGADMAVQDLTIVADATGGRAGRGSGGFAGGIGGQAQGGAISLSIGRTIEGLTGLSLTATGTGGSGATSYGTYSTGGDGSQGGDGIGGSIMLELIGAGATLPAVAEFAVDVTGVGGSGGLGGYGYSAGGDGGIGGDGIGGELTLASRSGASIELTGFISNLAANGIGGAGGVGGVGGYNDGVDVDNGGAGGAGGSGTGGVLNLVGQGGAIVGGDIDLTAAGIGGVGGTGGYSLSGSGLTGPNGANGGGAGGLVSIQALEGSPGVITLGAVTIDASGFAGGGDISIPTTGGSIEITDASTDPAGLITMGSLLATALGAIPPAEASFTMSGDSGPITVTGNATVDVVGDINFVFSGSGQLVVGGDTTLTAGGFIDVVHTGNTTNVTSIDTAGDFTATAGQDFFAHAMTAISSGGALTITAQSISYEQLFAGTDLTLNATNGSITGILGLLAGGAIDLDATQAIAIFDADAGAGFTADAGTDVSFNVIVNSDGDLVINAGGNISGGSAINDAPGGSAGSDSVFLTAGGDIALTGTARSADDSVFLTAGGGIAAGAIDAADDLQAIGGGAVVVGSANMGNAALTALLQGSSVSLDSGTIAGNLRLNATDGDIGGSGTIGVVGSVDLDATGSIGFGTITAGTGFAADAGGDITFVNASTADNNLVFNAGGNISGFTARNLAANGSGGDDSVLLTAGGDVMLTGVVRAENNVIVSGVNIALGTVNAALGGTGALDVQGSGAVSVGIANTGGAASALIQGASVTLGGADVGGTLRLNATAGNVLGSGTIDALGAIDLDATGDIAFGTMTAGTGFTADAGGNIAFTDASTSDNNLVFTAGGNISGTSARNLAANGSGGDDSVQLTAGGDVALTGVARAENNVVVSGVNVAIGTINAALGGTGALDVQGTGAVSVGTANTGGSASALIRGASVDLGAGAVGGNLTLDATDGDLTIDRAGTVTIGGAADFDATGSIDFGSITAGSGFTADAGANIGFIDAGTSDNNLVFTAGGDIDGNSASNLAANGSGGDDSVTLMAGGDVTLTGASRGENNYTVRGTNIALGTVNAATGGVGALDIQATNLASVGTATTGGVASGLIQGTSVALSNASIGGNLRLNATDGGVAIDLAGTVAIGGVADFDATDGISFGTVTAGAGFTADAGGDIVFVDASTNDNNLVFTAGGNISGVSARNLASAGSGGDDSVLLTASGDINLTGVARAENSVILRGVNVAVGAINAALGGAGALDLQATGAASVGTANTFGGASALIQGASVTLGSAAIGGALQLNATAGDVMVDRAGTVTIGGAADFDATGSIDFGTIAAGTGFTADAGGDILFASATTADNNLVFNAGRDIAGSVASNLAPNGSGGDDSVSLTAGRNVALTGVSQAENNYTVSAGGAITGGSFAAGGRLSLSGASIAILAGSAATIDFVSGGDILFDSLASPSAITLIAASGAIGGNTGTGDIASGGNVSLAALGIALGDVTSGGSVNATASAGDASFGTITATGNVDIAASGTPTVAGIASGGDTSISGSSVAFGNGTVGGDLTLTATAGDIDAAGAVTVGGGIAFTATGDVEFGSLAAQDGDFTIDAGGMIAFANASTTGAITAVAGGTLTAQSAVAGGALDLRAVSTLTIADAVGGSVALRSTDGAVIVTHDIGGPAIVSGAAVQITDVNDLNLTVVQATDGDIDAVAAGDIRIGSAESVGDINLTSTGGGVVVSRAEAGKGDIVPAGLAGAIGPAGIEVGSPGPGNILIDAATDAQGVFIASGNVGITAGGVIQLQRAAAGGSILLDSGDFTQVSGTASAGDDIAIVSGGDVLVSNSEASLEAGGDLTVFANGTFDTRGFAYGTSVAVTARDVNIGSQGRIGDSAPTQSVTFTSIGGPVVIGGTGQANAFSLDAGEFGRIRNSGDLSILARSEDGEPVSLIVRNLEIAAGSGGPMGAGRRLLLDSEGGIDVLGALEIAGANGDTVLDLRSGGRTWLDTAGGNLRVEDANGGPTGTIAIHADRFVAASEAALAAIDGLSAADVDARLGQNDGIVRDEGFIQAGALEVSVSEALLIQNSGAGEGFDERRGFAVGTFAIDTSEGSNPLVVINGTVGGATGTATIAAIEVNGTLDAGSTVNGCAISNPASCVAMPEIEFFDPSKDLIEEEIDPGAGTGDPIELPLVDIVQPEGLQDDPLIDDPVTGAGNEDLWQGEPECESGEDGGGLCPTTEEEVEPAE